MKNSPRQSRYESALVAKLRRRVMLLMASLLVVVSSPIRASSAPRLFVFVSADMRAQALEKELETHLAGVDVTVFGRIRGFQSALAEGPDGVLARAPVLSSLNMNVGLQGLSGSKDSEPYVLVSANSGVRPGDLGDATIGVVDILGRRNMGDFVSDLLSGVSPKLKYVTHERDLLALLQFGAVEAVVTSEDWANRFRSKSEMNLVVTPLGKNVGLPAVAFPGSGGGALEGRIRAAGGSFNQVLGVTKWR